MIDQKIFEISAAAVSGGLLFCGAFAYYCVRVLQNRAERLRVFGYISFFLLTVPLTAALLLIYPPGQGPYLVIGAGASAVTALGTFFGGLLGVATFAKLLERAGGQIMEAVGKYLKYVVGGVLLVLGVIGLILVVSKSGCAPAYSLPHFFSQWSSGRWTLKCTTMAPALF